MLSEGLRDPGYVEGRNFVFERLYADGKLERLPGLAAELVRLRVDVIVASSNPAIADAKRATATIPIVMVVPVDPVGAGFIASLARPGANITGTSIDASLEIYGKNLALFTEIVPGLSRVGLLRSEDIVSGLAEIEAAARRLNVAIAAARLAATKATTTIPVVFVTGTGDPVKEGLVASLNRLGGNVTGVALLSTALDAKRLGLLHETLPSSAAIAVLVNPASPIAGSQVKEGEMAARTLGRRIRIVNATGEREIDMAFAALAQSRAGALLVTSNPFFYVRRQQLVDLAAHYAVPAMYEWREFVAAGGLMSYGTSITNAYRQAGIYVGAILKGAKPADLPVLQPTKFELVINLNTAKVLGLVFPPSVLLRADEVIQ